MSQMNFSFRDADSQTEQSDTSAPAPDNGHGRLERRSDGWWIVGLDGVPDCGAYATKVEAADDLRGMRRTLDDMEDSR